MSKPTAKFVFAIFAGLLGGAALVTESHSAPAEADKCLAGPKGAPPAGGHWYYRIDRATKRPCWYIGDAKEKLSRAAPETSPPAANSVAPPKSAGTPLSIANARAELPLPQTRVERQTTVFTGQPAAVVASPAIGQRPNVEDDNAQRSVVASRWFEQAGMTLSAPAQPSAGNSADQPQVTSEAALPTAAVALPLAAADASPLAAADASPARPSGSVQMLLIAILGALGVAGLLASAIFRLSARRTGRRRMRGDRRVNWDSARTELAPLSDEARAARSIREFELPRQSRAADDPDERIAQLLTRLPRSAAT